MPHERELSRRNWLRRSGSAIGVGAAAGSMSGWLRTVAAASPRGARSIIVLWLNGGPATIDLWDLKPGHANGGPFREIETTAAGLRISEHLPKLALWGTELAVVRSMASRQGDHGRATYLLRTGYDPVGAVQFPAVGSLVARENGSEQTDLPNFVSVAPALLAGTLGSGFLGPNQEPLVIGSQLTPEEGLKVPDLVRPPGVGDAAYAARIDLLAGIERRFEAGRRDPVARGIRAAATRATRLMRPEAAAAFQLDEEPTKTRDTYGRGLFGQGCLLARRLVERGVSFVEVTLDGWDTHSNNFDLVRRLSGTLDAALSALIADLKDRGLLDSTLVCCQGEFGRTPAINKNVGRDHWPAAWAVALAGGGIRGGQAVGRTTADGVAVEGKATTVPDLIATVVRAVGIDPMKQNVSNVGRPIRIADPSAKPIEELL